jgi:hypothetical protein
VKAKAIDKHPQTSKKNLFLSKKCHQRESSSSSPSSTSDKEETKAVSEKQVTSLEITLLR